MMRNTNMKFRISHLEVYIPFNPSSGLISVVRRAQYLASMKVSDDVVRKENVDRDEYASVHTLVSA